MIFVPIDLVRAVGSNLIVTPTDHYCKYETEGGLMLPTGADDYLEKKYDIGVVISVGEDFNSGIHEGDVVLWQCTSAWKLPNGQDDPIIYLVPKCAVIAVLPNPVSDTDMSEEDRDRWAAKVSE